MKRFITTLTLFAPLALACCGAPADLDDVQEDSGASEGASEGAYEELSDDLSVAGIFKVAEYIKKAFDYYSKAKSVLGNNPNDVNAVGRQLSAELASVQGKILDAIDQSQVDALHDDVDYLLTEFIAVSPMLRTDSEVSRRRSDLETDMARFIHAYANRVEREEPVEPTLSLAPAFNAIVTSYVAVLKMKGEIDPAHPAPWSRYNAILSEALHANYRLVSALEVACPMGNANPGHPHYCVGGSWCNLRDPVRALSRGGLIFKQRADFRHRLDCSGSGLRNCSSVSCNAAQNRCWDGSAEHPCLSSTPGMRQTFQACLWDAREEVNAGIDSEENVAVIREAMMAIRRVGGGESPRDNNNTTLPTRAPSWGGLAPAAMVDPKLPISGNCPRPRGSTEPIISRWYLTVP